MSERGISLSVMRAAIEFGKEEKRRSVKSFWLTTGTISKWEIKGIDLSWAMGVKVQILEVGKIAQSIHIGQ